jgi:hypothetical protein
MDEARALSHVHASNLPHHVKRTMTDWYRSVMAMGEADLAPPGTTKSHMTHQIGAVRQGIGSALTGFGLGMAQASLPHGLDLGKTGKLPLDGIGGAIGLFGGAAMAAHGVRIGNDVRNAGAVAVGIYTFRKGHDFETERKLHGGHAAHAAVAHGEDPIIAAARHLA